MGVNLKSPTEGEAGREGTVCEEVCVVFQLRTGAPPQTGGHTGLVAGALWAAGDAGGEGGGGAATAVGGARAGQIRSC